MHLQDNIKLLIILLLLATAVGGGFFLLQNKRAKTAPVATNNTTPVENETQQLTRSIVTTRQATSDWKTLDTAIFSISYPANAVVTEMKKDALYSLLIPSTANKLGDSIIIGKELAKYDSLLKSYGTKVTKQSVGQGIMLISTDPKHPFTVALFKTADNNAISAVATGKIDTTIFRKFVSLVVIK